MYCPRTMTVTCNVKAIVTPNKPMTLMYRPIVFWFCHWTAFQQRLISKGHSHEIFALIFLVKQFKCVATYSLMEVHTWSTPWSGNPTHQGLFIFHLVVIRRSFLDTDKIAKTMLYWVSEEKKRVGSKFWGLYGTWLFMVILPDWDTLIDLLWTLQIPILWELPLCLVAYSPEQ